MLPAAYGHFSDQCKRSWILEIRLFVWIDINDEISYTTSVWTELNHVLNWFVGTKFVAEFKLFKLNSKLNCELTVASSFGHKNEVTVKLRLFLNLRDGKCILGKIQARSFKIENQVCQWNLQWVGENYCCRDFCTNKECIILNLNKKRLIKFSNNFLKKSNYFKRWNTWMCGFSFWFGMLKSKESQIVFCVSLHFTTTSHLIELKLSALAS